MNKPISWLLYAVTCLVALAPAFADDKIVVQLKWVHQAQFAGYYVAQEKGYYADQDLEVEIHSVNPTMNPAATASTGAADVIIEWMSAALRARQDGVPLVNIAQPFKHSAIGLTCLRSSNITTLDDLRGKKIGHWPGGNKLLIRALLTKLGINISTDAAVTNPMDARLIEYDDVESGLKSGNVDCITTLSYIDPILLSDAGFHPNELRVFAFDAIGMGTLEDGLYVLEDRLQDDQFADAMARFVHASMKGWRWAKENQAEAVSIVLKYMGDQSPRERSQQIYVMAGVAEMIAESNGALEEPDYRRTVDVLLDSGVLSEVPRDAWTDLITDRANLYD